MNGKRFCSIEDVQRMVFRSMGEGRMTQREFAEAVGLHEVTISKFLTDGKSVPKLIADYFGIREVIFYERIKK